MVEQGLKALKDIQKCVKNNINFVLQGGAGSGKTETLKRTLEYLSNNKQDIKIACITHTNLAANEIKSRVGDQYTVSTIHSFLNTIIKDYKKNIHQVIYELFKLELMERKGLEEYDDEKNQKKSEHGKYKKLHGKYTGRLFTVKKEKEEKVEGKKKYDLEPEKYNGILNDKINALNQLMSDEISAKDHNKIKYNDTRFNSYNELTYGHDGLLDLSKLLFEKYSLLGKILQDRYDCIFIDEYQDTNEKIISIFLEKLPNKDKTLVGLFGDSMQAIYGDGIGNVLTYIDNGILTKIDKEDNFRCSEQVKDFVNQFRYDGLKQDIAFKTKDGVQETLIDRQGNVEFYYSIYDKKPNSRSPIEDRDNYTKTLDQLIEIAIGKSEGFKQLKLTNKSIASDVGFSSLYKIFDDRYVETQENLEKALTRLQFSELFELCNAYNPSIGNPDYNKVLKTLSQQGFTLKKLSDKQNIKDNIDKVMNSKLGAFETLNLAFKLKLIKKSENHELFVQQGKVHIERVGAEEVFKKFKAIYSDDGHTFTKFNKKVAPLELEDFDDIDEDDFKVLERDIEKETFYNAFFSSELKFTEILLYFNYQAENTNYITMHKTKGGEIENVLVVLDEYFWAQEYNFKSAFCDEENIEKKQKNQRLIYVACSRAKTNLKCVRLVADEAEATEFKKFFENVNKIKF